MKPVCIILGGGGHASVLIDCMIQNDDIDILGVLDNNKEKGEEILGIRVLGDDSLLLEDSLHGITAFVVGVGGIKNLEVRKRLYLLGIQKGLVPHTIIHPSAIISKFASLGAGVHIFPGSVINANASIGLNTIINSGALVEHDCHIGSHTHIAPHAALAGRVFIGDEVHIGIGAIIREGITIGDRSIIGAGSVVLKDIPAGSTVYGVPAKQKKGEFL